MKFVIYISVMAATLFFVGNYITKAGETAKKQAEQRQQQVYSQLGF